MSTTKDAALALVIDKIRTTIAEDWLDAFDIDADTRFNSDLEIESIEFVKIADAIQSHYGRQLDIAGWLAGKDIQALIALSVGELADYIVAALGDGIVAALADGSTAPAAR